MKLQAVKGTRDFYPEAMRVRNWIADAWRRVSLRNGFEEYDTPIFEHLDLFTVKSGEEIAEQLFSFTDRGGRHLAIRPEITPSLARMVNAKINALPRPIKWFSIPRLCRAERPQRGRLREFFQWNIDVIGTDDVLADAECIFVAVDFLREVRLRPEDARVRIGSRPLMVAHLRAGGVPPEQMERALVLIDKRPKVSDNEFESLCLKAGVDPSIGLIVARDAELSDEEYLDKYREFGQSNPEAREPFSQLEGLFRLTRELGIGDWCTLDLRIVRGLAYYTGIVWEVIAEGERAVAGGGRYDDLLEVLGGPKVGAVGFGMGDVVLELLLQEKGLVPDEVRAQKLHFFVIDAEDGAFDDALKLVGDLRARGLAADFSYKRQPIGKQLKEANRRGARKAAIVQPGRRVAVKDLSTGRQTDLGIEEFLDGLG